MKGRLFTVRLDDATIDGLRQMALQRGLVCVKGSRARRGQGNITKLLQQLAVEWQTNAGH